MSKENTGVDGYPSNWARSCDSCHEAACTLYCHTDSMYLCNQCDESIHAGNPLQHERVWVCTVCENAPAAFICQADAASLCINCDIEIHSANALARRHHRVPIPPLSAIVYKSSASYAEEMQGTLMKEESEIMVNEELEEDETDSWLLLDLDNNDDNQTNSVFTYGDEVDEYLHLVEYSSCNDYQLQDQNDQQQLSSVHQGDSHSDSIVPVQSFAANKQQHQQQSTYFNEYEGSKALLVNSGCQRVPISFMNSGYLLKATSDMSNSYPTFPRGANDVFTHPSIPMPLQFTPTNREARVLRYREKRKARKFEKKIRYASRKANAETRPRVKGRFARKTEREFEVDQMFTTEDYGYGVVPSY